jgi:spore coat polysaccharide biosynthesis protein SpsF (cytidylyltransferase family)
MNKYYAVIQARVGSTRFPNKVMHPICEYKTVIEFLVRRLRYSKRINKIILAIPHTYENHVLIDEANRLGIDCVIGVEDNLIKRVLGCFYANLNSKMTDHYLKDVSFDEKSIMVDITSDCPFVCPYEIDYGIEEFEKYECDYVSNIITRSWPDGFDFQIYDPFLLYNLLYPVQIVSDDHIQHTGWNILNYNTQLTRRYGRTLKMMNMGAANCLFFHPDWGLTLDTKEDLQVIEKIHKIISNMRGGNTDNDYCATTIIQTVNQFKSILSENKDIKRKMPGV